MSSLSLTIFRTTSSLGQPNQFVVQMVLIDPKNRCIYIKYIFFRITGSYQGKNQPDGILKGDRSYLMESFKDGKVISIKVPEPKYTKTVLGN